MARGGSVPGERRGGRQKGTPNKDKQAFLDVLAKRFPNYHPVVAMAEIANDPEVDLNLRFSASKEVAQYVAPKLKNVEHSTNPDSPPRLVITWASE